MGNPSEHHKPTLADLFNSSPTKSTAHTNVGNNNNNNNHLNPHKTTYVIPSSPSSNSKKTLAPPFTKILSSTGNNIRSLSRKLSSKHVLRDVYINHSGSLLTHPSINRHHVRHHDESHDHFTGDDDGVFHDQYKELIATNKDCGDLIGPIDHHVDEPIGMNLSTIKPEDCAAATESSVSNQGFEANHHSHNIDDAKKEKEKEKEKEKRKVKFRDSIRYILVSNDVIAVSSARSNPEHNHSNDASMGVDDDMDGGNEAKKSGEEEEEIADMVPHKEEEWGVQGMDSSMMKKSASVGLFGKKWKKSGHYFSQEVAAGTMGVLNWWTLPGKKKKKKKKGGQYYSQELGMVTARQAGAVAPLDGLAAPLGGLSAPLDGLSARLDGLEGAAKPRGQAAAETWQEAGAERAGSHGDGEGGRPLDLAVELKKKKKALDLGGPLDLGGGGGGGGAFLIRRGGGRGRESGKRIKVYIEEGMIGLGWQDGVPVMLSAGSYEFADSTHHGRSRGFSIVNKVSDKTEFVPHGNLNRLRIKDGGHLGVAWVDARPPVLLHSGSVSLFSCHDFRFVTTSEDMLSLKEFTLGPFRIVSVADHEIGVKVCNRQPQVLKPGRHYLSMAKLEVFAGFESLLKRQSKMNGVIATSKDDMKIIVDICLEWQIKAEDATFARLANITDVETVVCEKTRRAFHLVMWDTNAQALQLELVKQDDDLLQSTINTTSSSLQPSLKDMSSKVSRECMELFEEGWTITLWDLQLSNMIISQKSQFVQDHM